MNDQIEIIKKTRKFVLSVIDELRLDQLNEVPSGFNNNIVWNIGHLIAAQQGLCYIRSGATPIVPDSFIQSYKSGSKPERAVDTLELETIKQLLNSTLDQLVVDYQKQLFTGYTSFMTRYGVEISNIDDAIAFLSFHEGMHAGYVMALKRVIC